MEEFTVVYVLVPWPSPHSVLRETFHIPQSLQVMVPRRTVVCPRAGTQRPWLKQEWTSGSCSSSSWDSRSTPARQYAVSQPTAPHPDAHLETVNGKVLSCHVAQWLQKQWEYIIYLYGHQHYNRRNGWNTRKIWCRNISVNWISVKYTEETFNNHIVIL